MKLIVLTSRVPWPLDKGDKLRIYHQIRYLSKSCDVELIAISENKDNADAVKELSKYCKKVSIFYLRKHEILFGILKAFIQNKPLQIGYFFNHRIKSKLNTLIDNSEADYLYGQLVRVAEYIKDTKINKVLDLQDALSAGLHRRMVKSKGLFKLILGIEYKRMLRYEKEELDGFNHLTIITQTDKDLLNSKIQSNTEVIPNGVDFDFFKPIKREKHFDLVFTGNMNYPPNIMAASFLVNEIMPIVWQSLPDTTLQLAGASPHQTVKSLASDKINVSGWLDDIRDAYADAKIFIAPMQIGTGLQNKLLEAMAMKLPCITSELANSALKAKDGQQILVAQDNDKDMYAQHIIKLILEDKYADEIANNGQEFVKYNYDWNSSINKLIKLFD